MTASEIVNAQIHAYNNRDIRSSLELFSDNIKILRLSDSFILVDGISACKRMFEDLFAKSPNLHAEVITNIVYENKVVLHEYVYGRNGSTERIEQLIIFEIKNEKIEVMYRA